MTTALPQPAFAGSDAVRQAAEMLAAACAQAADTITAVMTDAAASASCRLRAAKLVLDYAREHLLIADLNARLNTLETARGALPPARPRRLQPIARRVAVLEEPLVEAEQRRAAEERQQAEAAQRRSEQTQQRLAEEQQRAEQARQRAEEARQRAEEARQRAAEEGARKQAEADARWNAYLQQILPDVSPGYLRKIEESWESFGSIYAGLTHCDYTPPASWARMDTGQRLIAWLCDRYADYRAGLPVSLNQRMARGVEYDETGIPPHTCPKCSLRILDGFYDCPLCQTHLNVPKPPVSGGKLLLKAIANGAFR